MNKRVSSNQEGFTLIETIVVVFVFSVMALTVTGILIRAMQIERRSFSAQIIQENVLAIFESMAKEIRVSTISNQNNTCSPAASTLVINHPDEGTVTYTINAGVVQRTAGGNTYLLSSSDIIFNSLGFCISGSAAPFDDQSARVTIIASVSNRSGKEVLTNQIQTTITSRDITDELQN